MSWHQAEAFSSCNQSLKQEYFRQVVLHRTLEITLVSDLFSLAQFYLPAGPSATLLWASLTCKWELGGGLPLKTQIIIKVKAVHGIKLTAVLGILQSWHHHGKKMFNQNWRHLGVNPFSWWKFQWRFKIRRRRKSQPIFLAGGMLVTIFPATG